MGISYIGDVRVVIMMRFLLFVAASLTSYIGFAYLALAMPRHWAEASGRPTEGAPLRRWIRLLGYLLLVTTFALCVYRDGLSFGSVLWLLLLSVSAIAVALTLAWRPALLLMATHAGGLSSRGNTAPGK